MKKRYLPNKFILIEGIDGGGKSTFVNYLKDEIMNKYNWSENRSLSIFGQPSYDLENGNTIFNMIEYGKVSGNIQQDIIKFKRNRIKHERYITSNYRGLNICVRGVLTDIGTLYTKYGNLINSNVGQKIIIDLLIIVDTPVHKALERINKRDFIQWRENYKYLTQFKRIYLNSYFIKKNLQVKKIIVIKNKKNLEFLKYEAQKIVRNHIN